MGAASIRIDQPTNPTTPVGQPGRARNDLLIGLPISLQNTDNTDVLRWVWTMVDRPIGSTAVLSGTTSTQVTFTPDVAGSYLIRLAVNDGLAGEIDLKVAAILDSAGYRYPATGETAASVNWPVAGSVNPYGWGKDVEAVLREAAAGGSLAGTLAIGNTTGGTDIELTNGDEIVGEDGGSISFAPTTGDIVIDGVLRSPDGSASSGDTLELEGGAGDGALSSGGGITGTGGAGGAAGGAGGDVVWSGGPGGSTSGPGGGATVKGGDATAGDSAGGSLSLLGGQSTGAGAPGNVLISGFGALSGNVPGSSISIDTGDGVGSGDGGALSGTAGDGGLTGDGGMVLWQGGAGGGTSGAGGAVGFVAGSASGGNSLGGEAGIVAGDSSGNQPGAQGKLEGGAGGATGAGGIALVRGGSGGVTSGAGGLAQILGGAATAATATGGGVEILAQPGGSGAASGGTVSIGSGDGGGLSGNSGDINIIVGEVNSGTRGAIRLEASNVIIPLLSYHSVRGSTARGSANTLIYRWSSVVDNQGTDITYSDSATAGGSWAINVDGIYAVSFSIDVGHNGFVAIKKAAAVSNTFDATDIMVAIEAFTGTGIAAAWTGYCAAGSDIWIATSGATNPTGTPVNNQRCSVTRVR